MTSAKSSYRSLQIDSLAVRIYPGQPELAEDAAQETSKYLQTVLAGQEFAAAILATGNSQLKFLQRITELGGVDWSRVTLFHMDEYLGISATHKASFRRYMRERVESLVRPRAFHYLEGDALEPIDECERYSALLNQQPIDLCCMGVGENGHIAFNDPPVANFADKRAVKIVQLDDACKLQQVREGHFPSLEAVPPYALTLTIPALCAARKVVCISPETRKAQAIKAALLGPISEKCPASYLRRVPTATLLLDNDSASLLS